VNNFKYTISERFLKINSGVFTKKKTSIPFSRIQNVSISRGVFDRIFNLNTVKVETAGASGAGSQSGSTLRPEGYVPGVKDPSRLEDVIHKLVHQYTQTPPDGVKEKVFTDNVLAFDEFIAYIIAKMAEVGEIKTKIKELRASKNMTQAELADKMGVSRQTINYLEQGKYVPSLTLAMKIAKEFSISVEEIFVLEDEDYSKKKGSS
jgi:putative transcriptional regulator